MPKRTALTALSILGLLAIAGAQTKPTHRPAPKPAAQAAIAGCVDQDGDEYVLREDENLSELAVLLPEGFPKDGFAKYVGHKVKIQGTREKQGEQTSIRVRTIQTVSETCAPGGGDQSPKQ